MGIRGDEEMMMMDMAGMLKPAWLQGLMGETFFGGCGLHENCRKNEKNIFCLLCCLSICPHCLPSHRSHPLLQVRRYVYHDVVRLGDLEKLIDCAYIQPYTINHAKVIFLNQRPQSRSCKGSANMCYTCDRILQDSFHFCSLSCKVDYMVFQGQDLSGILYRIHESDFAYSQFDEGMRVDDDEDDGQITSNSFMEEPVQYKNSSCSDGNNNNMGSSGMSHEALAAGGAMVGSNKKMKKKKGFLPGLVLSLSNRRKGAPQRAPLS